MAELPFLAFDADNHYYESEDAFIRHIDPKMKKRCMQWAEIDGKRRFLVGGKVNKFIPNPTFDPIAAPGSLEDYFRGKNVEGDMDLGKMFGDLDPISEHPATESAMPVSNSWTSSAWRPSCCSRPKEWECRRP